MANHSKGMVIRQRIDTVYDYVIYDLHHHKENEFKAQVEPGKRTPEYLRKKVTRGLSDGQHVVKLAITGFVAKSYGMPEEDFFAGAKLLKEKES